MQKHYRKMLALALAGVLAASAGLLPEMKVWAAEQMRENAEAGAPTAEAEIADSDAAAITGDSDSGAAEITGNSDTDAASIARDADSDAAAITGDSDSGAAGITGNSDTDAASIARDADSGAAAVNEDADSEAEFTFEENTAQTPNEPGTAGKVETEENGAASLLPPKGKMPDDVKRTGESASDAEEDIAGAADSAEDGVLASGYCGDDEDGGKNISWVLTNDGKLSLTGEGATAFYNESDESWFGTSPVPGWYEYRSQVTSVEIGEGITELTSATFAGTNITSVVMPSTMKVIGQVTFSECSRLAQVTMNEGLEEIGSGAFCNTAITSITVPASVKKIDATNFSETRETWEKTEHGLPLENWIFSDDPDANLRVVDKVLYSGNMDTIFYCDPDVSGTYTMPDTVETVGDLAFEDCGNITELNLSANLKKVGFYSFFWCNGVTDLYIPDSVADTDIGAFGEMHGLKSISIGTGMTELGQFCFLRSYALTDVTFRGQPTVIGYGAFKDCESLEEITLPDSVQTIDTDAFANTALKEVRIPDSVTAIGDDAFPSSTKATSTSMIELGNGKYAASKDATKISYPVTYDQDTARSMLPLVNAFRTGSDAWYWNEDNSEKVTVSGLSELQYDYSLEKAAMDRAAELAISFSHIRPNGADCFTAIGALSASYSYEGENIAAGSASAKSAFTGWQETDENYDGQGHRRNMLESNFNAVGIAHVVCGGVDYWVQEFGYASSPDTTETAAVNETRTYTLSLTNENVTAFTVGSASPAAFRLTANGASAAADVPTVTVTGVKTSNTVGAALTVTAYPKWKAQDETIVEVSDGKINARQDGETSITGYVFGKEILISVAVSTITPTPTNTPEPTATPKPTAVPTQKAVKTFKDVSEKSTFYTPITWASGNKIVNGYSDRTFRPNEKCTRANFVVFLWRLAGAPASKDRTNKFTDTSSNAYYYSAVSWATDNNILKGYSDGTFRPDETISRGQVVEFLWRYAGRPATALTKSPFSDVTSANAFYRAIFWGNENKVVMGSKGYFNPNDPCTRGQVVAFLYRYAKLKK